MSRPIVRTIDCGYMDQPRVAAAYLLHDRQEAAFIETNTALAVPRMLAALADEGLSVDQVRYVIITHVHLDHAGGASALMAACPNATLLAHPRAARHVIDPTRLVASATAVYGEARFRELYGEIEPLDEARVRRIDDEERVSFGASDLVFLHTRGHANHHMVVHDPAADGIFTGDAFGIGYPDLQVGERFVFPSTSPTDFDGPAAHAALDRIVDTGASRAWLTHFGEHYDLHGMARDLHTQLELYEKLLERADATADDADLDRVCATAVAAIFEAMFARHPAADTPHNRALVQLDVDLNAQGIAFAVRRRRKARDAS